MAGKVKQAVAGRSIGTVTAVMSLVGVLACLSIVILVNLDIILRFLFSRPLPGVPEIVALSIVGIAFLQLPGCISGGAMTRSDLFVLTMRHRRPLFGRSLDAVMCLLGVIPLAVIGARAFPRTLYEYGTHEYVGTMGLFTFPAWPITLCIAIGCTVGCIQLVRVSFLALKPSEADALNAEDAEIARLGHKE